MKHKKYKKSGRVMALLLAVVLMLGLLPLPAGAADAHQAGRLHSAGPLRRRSDSVALRQRGRKRPADALRQGAVRLYAL